MLIVKPINISTKILGNFLVISISSAFYIFLFAFTEPQSISKNTENTNNILTDQAEWMTSSICFTPTNYKNITLQQLPKSTDILTLGDFVQFKTDGTFHCYSHSMCGNGCFTEVSGAYILTDNKTLMVAAKKITYSQECSTSSLSNLNRKYHYTLEEKEGGYLLKLKEH